MKKLVRLLVVPAAALAVQAAFAANKHVPQSPQPVPPIIQPHPQPFPGPMGPVDPTPTQPPPTGN